MGGTAMMIANKLSMALSRVISTNQQPFLGSGSDEEEEVNDLLQMIEELNAHTDLTVKLNNQSKLCRILLEKSPEIRIEEATPVRVKTMLE